MATVEELLGWLSPDDFAVLSHGWAPHGRDYLMVVHAAIGADPGVHELTFTHCVRLDYETRVGDDAWSTSWDDKFIDYQAWQDAGHPPGYVWGVNCSNAYPGVRAVADSPLAHQWSVRLGRSMWEVRVETNQFELGLVFHEVRWHKLGDV